MIDVIIIFGIWFVVLGSLLGFIWIQLMESNRRLNKILEAFKSWQSQDKNYHNRAEKIMKNRR